ncbi:hypothetical protein JX266_011333 [Neoarthrinium moseri]|nr:hypothetical protein JX266_011333 [Neoarthrinium moseri]
MATVSIRPPAPPVVISFTLPVQPLIADCTPPDLRPILGTPSALNSSLTMDTTVDTSLPIGGASAAIFFFLVHLKPAPTELQLIGEKLKTIDGPGLVLFAASITMLLLALQWGGVEFAWSSSVIIGLFVGFSVVLVLAVGWIIHRGDSAAFFVNGPFQTIIYWLPVWFQGVLQNSPTASGVNFFPTVIADVLAAFIGSALVSQRGWWNPFVILGSITVSIGGSLLTTIYPDVPGGHWIGYQIQGGVGYSLSSNLSHLAMQTSLPQDLVPLGASTLLSVISTSCAIFMAIGQARDDIIDSGVTHLDTLVDPSILRDVVDKYSLSVTQVFYIPAVAPVISFFLVLGCKWISTKSKQAPEATEKVDTAKADV